MKRKHLILTIMALVLSLFLVACDEGGKSPKPSEIEDAKKPKESKNTEASKDEQMISDDSEEQELRKKLEKIEKKNKSGSNTNQETNLVCESLEVLELIKDKDFEELSNHIHPEKGVRFSPYFFVDPANHQVLTAEEVESLGENNAMFDWGTFDGTGDTINLDFNGYYERFIFDHDYTNAHLIGNNVAVGVGNIMDNVSIEYPDGEFIEYHFKGFDQQYEGMDWRSLRLVFEESNGTLYLVGIVHEEWTT